VEGRDEEKRMIEMLSLTRNHSLEGKKEREKKFLGGEEGKGVVGRHGGRRSKKENSSPCGSHWKRSAEEKKIA